MQRGSIRESMGCSPISAREWLQLAHKQVLIVTEDASSVKSFVGRWRIIKFRLEKLSSQLQDMSRSPPYFLENYSLCAEILQAIVATLQDARLLAQKCRESSYAEGKLQMQSNLDSVAARFNQHVHDCDIVIKNSAVKESVTLLRRNSSTISNTTAGGATGVSREILRWAVRDLVTRLQIETDPRSKHRALNSIVELMDRDDKNVLVVAGQGGIPVLVHLLDAGVASAMREKAASAVCCLARAGSCEQELVAEGAVAPLVRLLESGTALAKEHAASALQGLSYTPENARAVAAHGGVPALVEICRTGTPGAQAAAAGSLRNLALLSEIRTRIAEEEDGEMGAIPALVALVRSGTASARESAIGALHSISQGGDGERAALSIARLGAVEAIVRFLDSAPPDKPRELAVSVLRNIAASGGAASSGACKVLVSVLDDDDGDCNDDSNGDCGGAATVGGDKKTVIVRTGMGKKRLTLTALLALMANASRKQMIGLWPNSSNNKPKGSRLLETGSVSKLRNFFSKRG